MEPSECLCATMIRVNVAQKCGDDGGGMKRKDRAKYARGALSIEGTNGFEGTDFAAGSKHMSTVLSVLAF